MSVLIKGMDIPKSCDECKFFVWKRLVGQYCDVDDKITFHATINGMDVGYERNGECPLIPIPPHGRLIDYDQLIATLNAEIKDKYDADINYFLRHAPTVIEEEQI